MYEKLKAVKDNVTMNNDKDRVLELSLDDTALLKTALESWQAPEEMQEQKAALLKEITFLELLHPAFDREVIISKKETNKEIPQQLELLCVKAHKNRVGHVDIKKYNYYVIIELKNTLTDSQRENVLAIICEGQEKFNLKKLDEITYCKDGNFKGHDDFGGVIFFYFQMEEKITEYCSRLEYHDNTNGTVRKASLESSFQKEYSFKVVAKLRNDLTEIQRNTILRKMEALQEKLHIIKIDSETFCKAGNIKEQEDFGAVTVFFCKLKRMKMYFDKLEYHDLYKGEIRVEV